MPNERWRLTVEDSIESDPFALADDLVVVVRTPRSDDFVTVEVGPVEACRMPGVPATGTGVAASPRPAPWVDSGWCGEVHVGRQEAVTFELGGRRHRLTLERIDHSRCHWPWGAYELVLERDAQRPAGGRPA